MAVVSGNQTIQVFKFRESGFGALCEEVASYLRHGDSPQNFLCDADLDSVEFVVDDNYFIFSFSRK